MNKKCKKNANAYIPPQTKQLLETARGGGKIKQSTFAFSAILDYNSFQLTLLGGG
jgi:hypothetical protein